MLTLRKPQAEDMNEIVALYQASKNLHIPWTFPPNNYSAYLADDGRYFLCKADTHHIVGTFRLSNIVRGFFHSAYLGYEVFSPHQRQGFMRIGIKLIITEAFNTLNLHRLEANIQPENTSSIKLVQGAGFIKEGFSKNYLNIGNKGWKDHERWALLNENWQNPCT